MYKNKIGRYILSLGSNEEATRLSGINTDKYKIIAYTLSGLGAGIAAIFWSSSFVTVASAQETVWNLMPLPVYISAEQVLRAV